MTDRRTTTFAGAVQTLFLDSFEADPMPKSALMAMANTNLVPVSEGSNTFRLFYKPWKRGTRTNLTDFRALGAGLNPLTTDATYRGQLAPSAMPNKHEDVTVDTVYYDAFDIDGTSGLDAKYNSPERVAARAREVYQNGLIQHQHEEIAMQAIYSDEWLVPAAATSVTSKVIAAGATTFNVTNAIKTSTAIAAGDLVKIGAKRTLNATDGVVEDVDVVLVKTVGADDSGTDGAGYSLITIEADATLKPTSYTLTGNCFAKVKIALTAHASGVRIQVDRPIALSSSVFADTYINQLRTLAARAFIDPTKLTLYMSPEVFENLSASTSPITANFLLGEKVFTSGDIATVRGLSVVSEANAISRSKKGLTANSDLSAVRHYVWAFERNNTFAYAQMLKSLANDDIPGTAGLLSKLSWADVSGSILGRQGAIRSILMVVTVS